MRAPAPSAREGGASRLAALFFALLVVVVAWTGREIPGFDYAPLMDDDTNVMFNAHLGVLDGSRLWWMFTDIDYVARYMPLGWLSFNLLTTGSELSPVACHVAGLVFHACNAVLVFFCLRRLLRRFAMDGSPYEQTLAAGLGALLWAVHPLRVEPVAWCSGLLFVQGSFFALVASYARLRELEARTLGDRRATLWFALGAAAFAVSLLTYPVALFLPALIFLLDLAWRRTSVLEPAQRRALNWGFVCLVLMSAGELAVTIYARHVTIENGVPPPTLAEFGLGARGFQAGFVWASYLWRTVWPMELTPVVEAIFQIRAGDVRIWGGVLTLLVVSALAWRWRRVAPFFGACWVGYLFWMIPFLGLIEHPHYAADRYSYLVSVLFSLVLALAWLRVRSPARSRATLALGVLGAGICAVLFQQQTRIWRDPVTMHRYVLAHLRDPDLRNITQVRIAKLQFLAGGVRDGRAAGEKVYVGSPHIAGVARSWREMAPANPLPPEVAARPLQEWPAAPWACLHERIAAGHLREGRTTDARMRLNAALALAPDFVEARFRRAILLAQLGEPRAALHDWLAVEARTDRQALAAEGMQFAADQIATAFRAAGEESLAAALQQRAAASTTVNGSATSPPAR